MIPDRGAAHFQDHQHHACSWPSDASVCSTASTVRATMMRGLGEAGGEEEGEEGSERKARGLLDALQKATGTWIPYSVDAHAGKYWLLCMSTRHDVPWIGTLKLHCGSPESVWAFRLAAHNISGCFCVLRTSRDHATLMKRMAPSGVKLAVRLRKTFAQENALFVYLRDHRMLLSGSSATVGITMNVGNVPPKQQRPPLPVAAPPPEKGEEEENDRHHLRRKLRDREQDLAKMKEALLASEQKYEALLRRLRNPELQRMTLEEFHRTHGGLATTQPPQPPPPSVPNKPPKPQNTTTPQQQARYMGGLYSQPRNAYLDAEEAQQQTQQQRSHKRVLLMDWKS